MPRPTVTAAERRQARQQDGDKFRLLRMGIDAATRFGFRAQQAALATLRRGGRAADVVEAMRAKMSEAGPLLTRAMVAGHLTGRKRAATVRAKAAAPLALRQTPLSSEVYDLAVESMQARFSLGDDAIARLADLYGKMAGRVLEKAADALEVRLRIALSAAVSAGEHVREGRKLLLDAFASAGVTPDNSFTLEAIFRTQTNLAYGAGRWQAMQADEVQEILWGFKYVTVGDDRVRPEHVGFEGVTLPKADPFWTTHWPPNGWACRCVTIELFDERDPVEAPSVVDVDGRSVRPSVDAGFAFNPGIAFAP